MRHRLGLRKLNRTSSHRLAMLRNMTVSLLRHETIKTTLPKAKELRRVVEPIITLGKKPSLANRRLAFDRLRDREMVVKVFDVLGPRYAGRNGGYGNTVIIQHGQRYRTLYAHMQGFAKGIRNGANVKQGQIIGYIGNTGSSTGPHLHYEFQVNGVHVDPLSQKLPMADPIAASEKQRFMQLSKPLMARMDQEKATMLAANQQ